MHGLLDRILVGAVILASFAYALAALGPRSFTRRFATGLASVLRGLPAGIAPRRIVQRLEAASSVNGAGACGSCDNCGPAPTTPEPEIRVPVSKIGRRS